MSSKISPIMDLENQSSIYEVNQQNVLNLIILNQIEKIPKKRLNSIVFLLNVLWMLLCCHGCLYYIFAPLEQRQKRGILAGIILALTVIVAIPTFFYLVTFTKFFKLVFILDTIQLVTIIASLSFVSMILLFDTSDDYWHFKVIEVGFVIEAFCYSTMLRVMLVTLDWSKWQVIVFKLHAMMNCFMFFVSGIYFIYDDFSYTFHLLASFDKKVHDFMVLFIFTMFSCIYEFYRKITDLDYTGDLKYTYKIKNVDQNRHKLTRNIMQKRKQSIITFKRIEKSQSTIESDEKNKGGLQNSFPVL